MNPPAPARPRNCQPRRSEAEPLWCRVRDRSTRPDFVAPLRDRYIPGTLDRRPTTQTLERYRHSYVEKLAHGALGPEHVHRHMLSVLRQDLQLSFALRAADSPDAPNQAPFI